MSDTKEPRRFWILDNRGSGMIIKDPQFYELIKKEHPKDCFEVIEAAPIEARIRELEAQIKTVVKINLKLEAALERES